MHSALCGPFPTADISGNKYMLTLVDDFSRLTITKAVQNKSDIPKALQEMILKFESMTGCHVKNLWTNWGAEFRSHKFLRWLEHKDIVPHYSRANVVAEQIARSIWRMAYINLYSFPRESCYIL